MKTPITKAAITSYKTISRDNYDKSIRSIRDVIGYINKSDRPQYQSVIRGQEPGILVLGNLLSNISSLISNSGSTTSVATKLDARSDKGTTPEHTEFGEVVVANYTYGQHPKVAPEAQIKAVAMQFDSGSVRLTEALGCLNKALEKLPSYLCEKKHSKDARQKAINVLSMMADFYKVDELAHSGLNFASLDAHGHLFDNPELNSRVNSIVKTNGDTLKLNCLIRHVGDNCLTDEQKYEIFKDFVKKYKDRTLDSRDSIALESFAGKENLEHLKERGEGMKALIRGGKAILKTLGLGSVPKRLSHKRFLLNKIKSQTKPIAKSL